ncbi:hypothetical protein CF640_36605 [Burkholderia pseudomallei]|nr:hypothetical protein CF640_36605 [Burkholderia pseudomallei]
MLVPHWSLTGFTQMRGYWRDYCDWARAGGARDCRSKCLFSVVMRVAGSHTRSPAMHAAGCLLRVAETVATRASRHAFIVACLVPNCARPMRRPPLRRGTEGVGVFWLRSVLYCYAT